MKIYTEQELIAILEKHELCLQYKKKGDKIFIDGHLEKIFNGELSVVANDIGFL